MLNNHRSFRFVVAFIALVAISAFTFAAKSSSGFGLFAPNQVAAEAPALPMLTAGVCDTAGPIEVESSGGTAAGVPTLYATLGAAFVAINGGVIHTGVITIDVCGNTDELAATATLQAGNDAGTADYTSITMSPAGGAARTITGLTTAGNPMIDLSGADNVTIDGLNTGGNSLTIANTTPFSTSGTSTIRFIGGATSNVITNSNIQGSGTMSVATNGAVIFFSTDAVTANGNDNNTISNNNIGPVGGSLPTKGILGNGSTTTTAIGNSGILINNNNIFDFFGAAVTSSGIATNGGCNTWTITNNRFYQTATRTWTAGATHRAIDIGNTTATSGAQGFTITGNIVGYASNTQTGVYTLSGSTGKFQGIVFNGITGGSVSNINNNTIASVSLTGVTSSGTTTSSPFSAIQIPNGLVNTNSNIIGSQSATGSLTFSTTTTTATDVYGLNSFASNNWITNDNQIGGITGNNAGATGAFRVIGMRADTLTSATWTVTSNLVGGTVANSIQNNSTSTTAQLIGIASNGGTSPISNLTTNTIRNLTAAGGTGTTSSASVIGFVSTITTPSHTISQNTIFNLANTDAAGASVVTGIQFTGGTANVVERNNISGLTAATTSATAEVNGIRVAGGTTTYRNNMINIGAGIANALGGVATNSSTTGINGFNGALGTDTFIHNSVSIGGGAFAGTGASYAFNGTQTVNTRSFRNNIFNNSRTNAGTAGGSNYAVKINGTAPNPTGLTINNNVYNANGVGGVFGFFNSLTVANLAAWQAAVGQDATSLEINPLFVSISDLHLQAGSPAIDVAANLGVTNDFDGDSRPGANALFDIGADERDGIAPVPNDMAATAFLDPTNGGSKLVGATFSPQASFTNVGTNAQTSVTVRYRICADVGCTTVLYNQTAVIPSIGTLATVNVTFPSTSIGTAGAYTIKATSELVGDTVPANNEITGTLNIQAPLAGTYTVGTGGNYPSLTNNGGIFEAINSLGASGNITIEILSNLSGELGTHALNEIAGGFSTTMYPCSSPTTITGSNAGALIRLNGADFVTIDGNSDLCSPPSVVGGTPASRHLTITNTNVGASAAVIHVGSNAADGAMNSTIRNVNVDGASPLTSLVGVSFGGATPGTIATGPNNGNAIINCRIRRSTYGIVSFGRIPPAQNTGTVIQENDISSTGVDRVRRIGIAVLNENGILIDQNSVGGIDNTGESADAIGISVGAETISDVLVISGGIANANVTRNKVNGVSQDNTFSAAGITIASADGGANTVANNMISGVISDGNAGDFVAGIFVTGLSTSSTRLYHNSISMTGDRSALLTPGTGQEPSYGVAISGPDLFVELKNNIFYTSQVAEAVANPNALSFAIGMSSTTFVNLDSNFNDFFSTGARDGGFRTGNLDGGVGTNLVDLTAWTAATGDDAAPNSQEVDPIYINPANDLHLNGLTPTPLLGDGGIGIGLGVVDFDNDPRPASPTAPEIGADELVQSATGVFPAGIFYNAIAAPDDQMSGSATITNSITLNGILNTGNFNSLTLECNAVFLNAGGGNYVVGTVNKQYCGTGAFTYPVGTTPDALFTEAPEGLPPEYTPVTVNVTAGEFPSFLSARAFDGTLIGFDPANSLSRNWQLEELGDLTADLSFTYLDGAITDVNGTEANYIVYRRNANGTTDPMCLIACVDTINNILGPVTGVTQFSRWSGAALVPTAAGVDVAGRVLVPGGGGLRNAIVTLTDSRGVTRTSRSSSFGNYKFEDVRVGETYILAVNSKRYVFTPRTVQVLDEVTGLDITADGDQ